MKRMSTVPTPCEMTDPVLRTVAEHLNHAQRSHALALRLQAQGETEAARQQSRMTRVFLHNALHRIDRHAPSE